MGYSEAVGKMTQSSFQMAMSAVTEDSGYPQNGAVWQFLVVIKQTVKLIKFVKLSFNVKIIISFTYS